jgi:5'-3' exonuclease
MPWLIIDGNNWFAQCDYASPQASTRNLLARLETLRNQIPHSLVAICWDCGQSFRNSLSSKYKSHRITKPDDYHHRLANTRRAIADHPDVLSLSVDGFEADDLIATLVQFALDEGEKAIIFSADSDLHQLLLAGRVTQVTHVTRINPQELRFNVISSTGLETKYQVVPQQWIDYRAIVGDKSDGIDGCRGLGPTAAAEVLRCCGSLDRFYASPLSPRITAKQRDSLIAFRDELPLKRQLLTLVGDVPLPKGAIENHILRVALLGLQFPAEKGVPA